MIEHSAATKEYAARNFHLRRGTYQCIQGAYTDLAQRLCEDWKEKLDIEAEELDKQETTQRRKGRQPAGDPVPRHDATTIDAPSPPAKTATSAAVTRAMLVEKLGVKSSISRSGSNSWKTMTLVCVASAPSRATSRWRFAIATQIFATNSA